MNEWHRLDGPTRTDPEVSMTGDDARGEYFWTSLYGCGLARAEVTHYLAAHDIMEEWGNTEDGGCRVGVVEITMTYIIDDRGEPSNEDYQYESVGLHDFDLVDAERAYAELDRHGVADMAWAFCGPDEKSAEVYARNPRLTEWDAAMNSEDPLDITV